MPFLPAGERGGVKKPNRSLQNPISSSSSSPTSTSSPLSLGSPLPSWLSTSLPSSPPSPLPCFNIYPRPKPPLVWTWICHLCNRSWPLGTTQRCLSCGHRMCLPPKEDQRPQQQQQQTTNPNNCSRSSRKRKIANNSASPQQPLLLSSLLSADGYDTRRPMAPHNSSAPARQRYKQQLRRHYRRGRASKERKKKMFHCLSHFDYAGWEDYNAWRRDVKKFNELKNKRKIEDEDDDEEEEEEGDSEDTDSMLDSDDDEDEKHDKNTFKLLPATGRLHVVAPSTLDAHGKTQKRSCWDDCDYPTQCIQDRYEKAKREASLNRVFL